MVFPYIFLVLVGGGSTQTVVIYRVHLGLNKRSVESRLIGIRVWGFLVRVLQRLIGTMSGTMGMLPP